MLIVPLSNARSYFWIDGLQVLFIGINTLIVFTGTGHFMYTVPASCLVCLVILVFKTLARLWKIEMTAKLADK